MTTTELTLHRAGRVLEAIRAAIGRIELNPTARISIFGDPTSELARKAEELSSKLDTLERLLAVQARIRAAVGRTNAELGISDVLAEKAAHEEWIKLASLVTASGSKTDTPTILRRHSPGVPVDAASLDARAKAMRDRFASSDASVEAEIEARLYDGAATVTLSKRIAERRRKVEQLSDRLRELNGRMVALDEPDLAYLTEEDVI
jgi:uncharacterized coiled-coil protein SlyX